MFKLQILACLLAIHSGFCSLLDSSDIGLDPMEIIQNHGYVGEEHHIQTEDGYILTYHRIPHGMNDEDSQPRPAVLLMHGLFASSADFVNMGPGRSLGFILADLGYDVWIGNARGNQFSRNHTKWDPVENASEFFNFSWHEMGYYDVANAIDYILDLKGDTSLYYIGHSQGSTIFLVLASTRPEYNSKVRVASLMAPAGILQHYPSLFVRNLCNYIEQLELLFKDLAIYEVPFLGEIREVASTRCRNSTSDPLVCDLLYLSLGGDNGLVEKDLIPVIYTNQPANTAIKQMIHFGQQIKNGGFAQFDFGPDQNLIVYGSEKPPAYNLSQITTPVAFYYARNDDIVSVQDEQILVSLVPSAVINYLIPYETFRHADFTFAKNVVDQVYNQLISIMEKY